MQNGQILIKDPTKYSIWHAKLHVSSGRTLLDLSWGPERKTRNEKYAFLFCLIGVRGSVHKSAGSAACLDYVDFQAVIKSAASAASLRGGSATVVPA